MLYVKLPVLKSLLSAPTERMSFAFSTLSLISSCVKDPMYIYMAHHKHQFQFVFKREKELLTPP